MTTSVMHTSGRVRRALIAVFAAIVAFGLIGFAGSLQAPKVVYYAVVLPDWPAGAPPLRIVQLSDLHGSWIDMPPDRIAGIVTQVNRLNPDLIVLTGDYVGGKLVDWPSIRLEDFSDQLDKLHALYGVFAVVGNHDTVQWTRWAFDRTHIKLLVDQIAEAGPVTLAGVNDITNVANSAVTVRALAKRIPRGKPVLLLAHEPDYFQYLPRNIDLMIAGHTHGGQIQLPLLGTRSLGPFLDEHLRGNFDKNGLHMIVSSGLGTSIVPMRIGVRPEIVEITVSGPAQASGRKSGTDR